MKEIEVKILDINKEEMIKKIESLGGKKVFEGILEDSSFDFEDRRLKKEKKHLRIRRKGDNYEFALKHTIEDSDVKSMDEHEVDINDQQELMKILKEIGLRKVRKRNKERVSFKFPDASIEIDTYVEIPSFLEIEATDAETVRTYVEKLGFTMQDTKPLSNSGVLELYRNKNKENKKE